MTHLSRHRAQAVAVAVLISVAAGGAWPLAAQAPVAASRADSAARASAARPLSLEEALRLAEDRSEGVRIARAGVLRARGQQYQARSQYLPQFTGGVTFVKTLQSQFDALSKLGGGGGGPDTSSQSLANSPIAKIFASRQTLTLGINGQWNVFTAGRTLAANRIASASRRSAEIGLASALASLQLQVTEAYYDAALAEQLSTIADSALAQSERTLSQVTLARNVGNTSEFELLRAQVTRDNQRPTVIQRRTQRDIALLRLKQLLDIPASDSITLASALSDTSSLVSFAADVTVPDAKTDTAAANRAQVRQVAEAVKVQQNQFRIARAQRLPALQLSTAYGRIAYPTSGLPQWDAFYPNWTVTAALSIPLFTGGRITGDEMVARANLTEARENLQQTKELAALDARAALADLEQAAAAWRASSGTSEQAAKAYRIAEVRYNEGISTQLELSESRLLLEQAAANRASAARNLKVAQVRLALIRDLPLGTVEQGAAGAAAGAGAGGAGAGGAGAQGGTTQQSSPQGQNASGATTTNSFGGQ
jgi:outer membrane protein